MKKLAIIALLALAVGYVGYRFASAESHAYKCYKCFADALLYFDYDAALEWAHGKEARNFVLEKQEFIERVGEYRWKQQVGEIFIGPVRTLHLEEESADGNRVTLKVVEKVRRGTVPQTAPVGPLNVQATHDVVMVKADGGWRVESFKEEIERLPDRR